MPTAAGSVTAGGTALAAAWDAASGTLWCDALLLPDQTVEVRFA
jgi:hypothetical protein